MKQLFFPAFFLIGCSEKYADFSILDASRENNLNAVIQHLNNCADVNQKDRYIDYTPLHYSAWNGDIDIAELLIVKGANLNARDKKNNTPLDVTLPLSPRNTKGPPEGAEGGTHGSHGLG